MQINGVGGVSSYYINSNQISKKVVNIPTPTYGWGDYLIATKTETNRTDDEIKNAMIELAKQDASKGIWGVDLDTTLTKTRRSEEYQKLMGEYVQSVSPDRRAIFAKGVDATLNEISARIKKPIIDNSLMELMLYGEVKTNVKSSFYYDTNMKMFNIGVIELFSENGEALGSYSGVYGWGQTPTQAEKSREIELYSIYKNAWDTATAEIKANGATTNANSASVSSSNAFFQQNQVVRATLSQDQKSSSAAQNPNVQQVIDRYEQMGTVK